MEEWYLKDVESGEKVLVIEPHGLDVRWAPLKPTDETWRAFNERNQANLEEWRFNNRYKHLGEEALSQLSQWDKQFREKHGISVT